MPSAPLAINQGTPNTRPAIYNSLDAASLSVITASSPEHVLDVFGVRVHEYSQSVAKQINEQRAGVEPSVTCVDLEKYIVDIKIETSAQGAGFITLDLIDPGWALLRTTANGTSFIDVDENGYLWPPIEINFPEGKSDAVWRLCQCKPSTDTAQANLSLVFEDKIVAELREHDQYTDPSCVTSLPNETRAEYIRRCVKTASQNPLDPIDNGIRFIPLLPNSVFTAADLSGDTTSIPTSAKLTYPASPARSDPNKSGGVSAVGSEKKTYVESRSPTGGAQSVSIGQLSGSTGRLAGLSGDFGAIGG